MTKVSKLGSDLVGVAGEYFVAAELSRRGYVAAITLKDSRAIDIIASKADGGKPISIQVKTTQGVKAGWILNKKSEQGANPNHFYVFVRLRDPGELPEYYLVPSKEVAAQIHGSHRKWMAGRRRDGAARRDSSMRKVKAVSSDFLDNWDSLDKAH